MFDENSVVEKAFRCIDGNKLNDKTINFAVKLTEEYANITGKNIDYITTAANGGRVYNEDGQVLALNSGPCLYLFSRGTVDGEIALSNDRIRGTMIFKDSGAALNIAANDFDSKFKKKEIRYFNPDTVKVIEELYEIQKGNGAFSKPFFSEWSGGISEEYFTNNDVIKPDEKFSYRSTEEFLKKLKEAVQLAKGEDVKHM